MQWLWWFNQKLDARAAQWDRELQPSCALRPLEQHKDGRQFRDHRVWIWGKDRRWSCYRHDTSR